MNSTPRASAASMKTFLLALLVSLAATPAWAGSSGASLFRENCASCHGKSGNGDGPVAAKLDPKPPNLTKSRLDEPQIQAIVKNGKNACPKWGSALSEKEISAVSAYAKSLQN